MAMSETTLVATLGGQPQIITFMLDLLLARGQPIRQVTVVYLGGGPRYVSAFRKLAAEFADGVYLSKGVPCKLRGVAIPSADARAPQETEAVRTALQSLLSELKRQGHPLHLGVSGGRRMLALVSLAVAMQYLTPADHIWHIYTPEALIEQVHEGKLMHLPPDSGGQLVEVPFVPWAAWFPGIAPLLQRDPDEYKGDHLGWLDDADRQRCRQVWQELSPRQREVLRAFSRGLTRKEAALQLGIAPTTIDTHRGVILQLCAKTWENAPVHFDIRFLREKFAPFLNTVDKA